MYPKQCGTKVAFTKAGVECGSSLQANGYGEKPTMFDFAA